MPLTSSHTPAPARYPPMASIPHPAAPSATLLIPAPPPKNDNVFSRVARTPYPAWTASALLYVLCLFTLPTLWPYEPYAVYAVLARSR